MKKIMLLALLAVVTAAAPGCQRPWFSRGASCNAGPTGMPDCHSSAPPQIQGVPEGNYLPSPISS